STSKGEGKMSDLDKWNDVTTLTEGLVTLSGWVGIQDGTEVAAERVLSHEADSEISFVVTENSETVDMVVRLVTHLPVDIDEGRFEESIAVISHLFVRRRLVMQLWDARLNGRSGIYEFGYAWRCDSELQQELTLPVLCNTVMRWSGSMSAPVFSIAPLVGLYLRGVLKRDEDFIVSGLDS